MASFIFFSAPTTQIETVVRNLKKKDVDCSMVGSLVELKKSVKKEKPALILVSDSLKEKKMSTLLPMIQNADEVIGIPLIGIIAGGNKALAVDFFESGAVDVITEDASVDEFWLRCCLRIEESKFRNALTSSDFFFSEAQEKEQGRRSGIFHFYNSQKQEVGTVTIKKGRVVHSTYGSIIKEDAFLQLACNSELSFRFEDKTDIEDGSFATSVTNLLLEAYKLKDEMKKQDIPVDTQLKAIIIDPSRIERLLVNRSLKNIGIESKVLSENDFSLRLMAQFSPNFLVLDCHIAKPIMDLIWQSGRCDDDIPVIIYCDEDVKDLNSKTLSQHKIDLAIEKKVLHNNTESILGNLFNISPVK